MVEHDDRKTITNVRVSEEHVLFTRSQSQINRTGNVEKVLFIEHLK